MLLIISTNRLPSLNYEKEEASDRLTTLPASTKALAKQKQRAALSQQRQA